MTTRKLLSVLNSLIDSMPFTDESRKDVKKSFKCLKEKIKLFNKIDKANENLLKEFEDLNIIIAKQNKILNVFKDYFNHYDDKTSFDTFVTSNYSNSTFLLIKEFLNIVPSKTYSNFELFILKEDLTDELLSKLKGFKNYAYILHDKDLNTKPHYHIYIGCFSPYTILRISYYLNLNPSCINTLKGSKEDILKYFIHDGLSDKHQYDKSEIIKNF